jgi:hypothetical protein
MVPVADQSDIDTDLAEMPPGFLIAEGVGKFFWREARVDHRLDARGLDRADHVELLLATADGQALKPYLLHHHQCGRNHALMPGKDTDQRDMAAHAGRADRLGPGAGTADLYNMIDTAV